MGNLGNGLKIRHIITGVSDRLDIDRFGAIVDSGSNIGSVIALHEFGGDAQAGQQNLELIIGTTVQISGRHNVITSTSEGRDGHELGCLARGRGYGCHAALQRRDALFKDIYSWVHDAAVDITELFESKKSCAVSGVIEGIGGGGIDGDCARIRRRVGRMALSVRYCIVVNESCKGGIPSVKLQGLEVEVFGHG